MIQATNTSRVIPAKVSPAERAVNSDQALNVGFGVGRKQAEPNSHEHQPVHYATRRGAADTTLVRDLAIVTGTSVGLLVCGASAGWALGMAVAVYFGSRIYFAVKSERNAEASKSSQP